jgi:hypothetical protein
LAQRLRALAAAPYKKLDLEGFSEDLLNTLPAEVTRHIHAADCVVLPAHLQSIPPWFSLHCPKILKVRMYDGERIEVCNQNLRELSLQPGKNLHHVSVFQGTELSTFGLSPIDSGHSLRLQSDTGLQPIVARVFGPDMHLKYQIPYTNRVFIECTPGSNPYEYQNNNCKVVNEEGDKITCRHIADKSSKLLVEWYVGGKKSSLGKLSADAFGSKEEIARTFHNTMDDRYFSNRVGGANLHLTTREGVTSYLKNQCLDLAEDEMRVYKIRLDSPKSGHMTTQGLWSEKMPDGRILFRSVNFDANSEKPRAIAVTDPGKLLHFEFFGGLHLPYTHLNDPIITIERHDGFYPKNGDRPQKSIGTAAPCNGSERVATFGGNFPKEAQPYLFERLMESNQSLEPARNWLIGKDAGEKCSLLERWAVGVPYGAVESIEELTEILIHQFRSGELNRYDLKDLLQGGKARLFLENAFIYSKRIRSPAISADGILAVGHMLEKLVSAGAISVSGALQVLLGNDWPNGTYAGKHLKEENYLPASAAHEVLEFWCRKGLIRESEIDAILHDASAQRIAAARSKTKRA